MQGIQQETGETSTKEKTILIVEDDAYIGEVLMLAIAQETPYVALLFPDGFQALHAVQNISPHLFILDYHLPRINGLDLYDRLHAIERLSHVPAIMISAGLPQHELSRRAIVAMNKPLDLDEFLHTIHSLIA